MPVCAYARGGCCVYGGRGHKFKVISGEGTTKISDKTGTVKILVTHMKI